MQQGRNARRERLMKTARKRSHVSRSRKRKTGHCCSGFRDSRAITLNSRFRSRVTGRACRVAASSGLKSAINEIAYQRPDEPEVSSSASTLPSPRSAFLLVVVGVLSHTKILFLSSRCRIFLHFPSSSRLTAPRESSRDNITQSPRNWRSCHLP